MKIFSTTYVDDFSHGGVVAVAEDLMQQSMDKTFRLKEKIE